MSSRKSFLLIGLCLFFSSVSLADHPNEGQKAISQLLEEALQNNLELKKAQEDFKSLTIKKNSLWGNFSPRISIEGGPQTSQFDEEKNSGSSLYGKIEWNIYSGGYDKSQIDYKNSEIELFQKKINSIKSKIKKDVSILYYELQFILESLALKQKALELNAQQMKMAKAKNSSGFTTSSDVIEFELRESTLESDLVFLNQQLIEKSRELNILLSRQNPILPEAVKGHLHREQVNFNRDDLLKYALENNEELIQAHLEIRQAESEKNQIQSRFLPQIDLEAQYGKLATEERVLDSDNNYVLLLKFNIPLFSGFKDYNLMKSVNSQIISNQFSLNQKSISIIAKIDSLLADVKTLNSRLDLEEKNLERSEKYYRLTLAEYRRGVKNSPDVVSASERLLETRIRNLEYRRDLMLVKAQLNEWVEK